MSSVDVRVPFVLLCRHLPVLRHCVGSRDLPILVARCARSDRPRRWGGLRNLILVTRHRLVVTSESRLLRRLRLHLNMDLSQLAEVAWSPDPDHRGVQLAATAADGVREHFWIQVDEPEHVWRLDAILTEAFTPRGRTSAL